MGFSVSRVPSPVCGLESCDFDTDSYRDGNRKQLRLWRMSTDINLWVLMKPLKYSVQGTFKRPWEDLGAVPRVSASGGLVDCKPTQVQIANKFHVIPAISLKLWL